MILKVTRDCLKFVCTDTARTIGEEETTEIVGEITVVAMIEITETGEEKIEAEVKGVVDLTKEFRPKIEMILKIKRNKHAKNLRRLKKSLPSKKLKKRKKRRSKVMLRAIINNSKGATRIGSSLSLGGSAKIVKINSSSRGNRIRPQITTSTTTMTSNSTPCVFRKRILHTNLRCIFSYTTKKMARLVIQTRFHQPLNSMELFTANYRTLASKMNLNKS